MRKSLTVIFALALLTSCGVESKLQEGQYAMKKSTIKIVDSKEVRPNELTPYIRSSKIYGANLVTLSKENIGNHMRYLGYYESVVTDSTVFKKKKAKVEYTVVPGPRITIDTIKFNLPGIEGSFRDDFFADSVNLRVNPGDYLSESLLEEERTRSASAMRNLGYYNINRNNYSFVADSVRTPGKLVLYYNVRSEEQPVIYRIGNVNYSIPESIPFRDNAIRSLNSVHPGDVYNESATQIAYNRLSSLRLFNNVTVELTPVDSALLDCNVKLSSSSLHGMKFNVEASTNTGGLIGISPQISYYHKNIFHGGEWLNLSFKGNYQFRFKSDLRAIEMAFNAGLSLPRFLGIQSSRFKGGNIPRTDIQFSINYQNRPEYNRLVWSVNYGYSGIYDRNGLYITYIFNPLRISTARIFGMSGDFRRTVETNPMLWNSYQDHIDAGVGGNIYLSSTSQIVPKISYKYLRFSTSLSGNVLSIFNSLMPVDPAGQRKIFNLPYSQYAKAELNLGRTWRFGQEDKFSFATRFVAGIGKAYGNSVNMPYEEQFYCGGSSSMRGWQARTLGPGSEAPSSVFVIPSQTGDVKLELGVEYRFPIVWKLEGGVFAETGNVWLLNSETTADRESALFRINDFYKSLAADWGVGLRLNLDFILIRVDAGFKLREPCRENPWLGFKDCFARDGFAVHFGVGYPF